MSPPIRVAVVGAGKMARQHLHALRRIRTPHVLVAICDQDKRAATELAGLAGATAYTAVGDLAREAKPDLVHVCTPPGTHFAVARAALEAGAHVYVEKPFVETEPEARELVELAGKAGLLICAGHQQITDPAFGRLMGRLPELGTPVQIDAQFAFRPPGLDRPSAGPRALAAQLLDVLPHPLATLVCALEGAAGHAGTVDLREVVAEPTELQALMGLDGVCGRLSVSLRARPVASTLAVAGTSGTLVADFIRNNVVGAANPGTAPLEKVLNPLLEAWQSATGGVLGLAGRLVTRTDYPGLAELLGAFYAAVAGGGASPLSPEHLIRVTALYETLAANVRAAAERTVVQRAAPQAPAATAPLAVVTGAGGFFGQEIARALALRGFRVRGVGRSPEGGDPHVHEWRRLDLGRDVPAGTFAGAAIVIHAAAASQGSYHSHERDTIEATANVLAAMGAVGCTRLVHVSSLSVLRPPRTSGERQDEATPLAPADARYLGPYTWGKTEAERLVAARAREMGIVTRVIRPAALLDRRAPDLPGLMGRRLLGRWHLGLGRPGLPFAACDVRRAAAAVAWCAEHFEEAPPAVNLMDPAVTTRGELLGVLRAHGWRGRMLWMPIRLFGALVKTARLALGVATRRPPPRLDVWAVFRPRRFDPALSARLLAAALADAFAAAPSRPVERRVAW